MDKVKLDIDNLSFSNIYIFFFSFKLFIFERNHV